MSTIAKEVREQQTPAGGEWSVVLPALLMLLLLLLSPVLYDLLK